MVPLTPVSTIVTYTKTSVTTRVDFKSSDHTKRPHNTALCLLCGCLSQGGGPGNPSVVAASMFNTGHKHATKDGSTILFLHVIAKRRG